MDGLLALSKLPGLCLEVMGTGILLVGGVPPEPCRKGVGRREQVNGLFRRLPFVVQREA